MNSDVDRRIAADALWDFAFRVFCAVGMTEDDAALVARRLVRSDMRGFSTHGVAGIPRYADNLAKGRTKARPDIRIEKRTSWAFVVDGDNGLGHVVATRAMDAVIATAESSGIGIATVRNTNHLGVAGLCPLMAAERGLIGAAMVVSSPAVAPWGSRRRMFGTSPLSVAAPAGRNPPFVFDMATSAAAMLKVYQAHDQGRPLPEGWAVDVDGRPTVDPGAALAGAMLPLGGAKGSGLAMVVEILAGVLSGSAFGGDVRNMETNQERPADSGNFLAAMDVEAFMPREEFTARMDSLIERINALDPAPGFDAVRVPGQRGARLEAEMNRDGVLLSSKTVAALAECGARWGVRLPV